MTMHVRYILYLKSKLVLGLYLLMRTCSSALTELQAALNLIMSLGDNKGQNVSTRASGDGMSAGVSALRGTVVYDCAGLE